VVDENVITNEAKPLLIYEDKPVAVGSN
jgi:hypothetical protein